MTARTERPAPGRKIADLRLLSPGYELDDKKFGRAFQENSPSEERGKP
jgi:hypothetical protein